MKSVKYLVLLLLLVIAGCGQAPSSDEHLSPQAANPEVDVATWFIDVAQFVPCAAGGAGETVTASGQGRAVFRTIVDASGGIHTSFHINYQGVSGSGLSTGDKYQGVGVFQGTTTSSAGSVSTFSRTLRLIGQGANNNLIMRTQFHLTFNANGELTAIVESDTLECQ
jgi:hypothetical protein